jgi:hypothetical protein
MWCFETESHGAVLAKAVWRRGALECLGLVTLGIPLVLPSPESENCAGRQLCRRIGLRAADDMDLALEVCEAGCRAGACVTV